MQEDLFTDGGRQAELQDIQDVLDRGGKELPGTVFSAAAALLTFLSALAEPVVPTSLHARAMEGNNNLTLCKQVCALVLCMFDSPSPLHLSSPSLLSHLSSPISPLPSLLSHLSSPSLPPGTCSDATCTQENISVSCHVHERVVRTFRSEWLGS